MADIIKLAVMEFMMFFGLIAFGYVVLVISSKLNAEYEILERILFVLTLITIITFVALIAVCIDIGVLIMHRHSMFLKTTYFKPVLIFFTASNIVAWLFCLATLVPIEDVKRGNNEKQS